MGQSGSGKSFFVARLIEEVILNTAARVIIVDPNGDWVALRMPYKPGSLIVLATPEPLLNEGLRDEQTARFVYRELLSGATTVAFVEVHHSFTPPGQS